MLSSCRLTCKNMFITLIVMMVPWDIHMAKFIKTHELIMYNFKYQIFPNETEQKQTTTKKPACFSTFCNLFLLNFYRSIQLLGI